MSNDDYVLDWDDVLYMQLLLQHFDAQRHISASGNAAALRLRGSGGRLLLSVSPEAVQTLRKRLSVGHVRGPSDPKKHPRRPLGRALGSEHSSFDRAAAAASGVARGGKKATPPPRGSSAGRGPKPPLHKNAKGARDGPSSGQRRGGTGVRGGNSESSESMEEFFPKPSPRGLSGAKPSPHGLSGALKATAKAATAATAKILPKAGGPMARPPPRRPSGQLELPGAGARAGRGTSVDRAPGC